MSDDLTPVEQARAARWAASWLEANMPNFTYNARHALRVHAAELVSSESVESLRAERDAARKDTEAYRRYWLGARQELDEANDTSTRLRATHTQGCMVGLRQQ